MKPKLQIKDQNSILFQNIPVKPILHSSDVFSKTRKKV